jgi:hypothetical protein
MKLCKGAFGVLLVLALVGGSALAAETEVPLATWQKEVKVGLNLLQSSYSQNWNSGEKGTVVWAGNIDARFENQFNESTNWRNTLKLAYGQTHKQARGADGSLFWQRPDKSDDIIDFESFFRWTTRGGWDPFVAFNFNSLFQDLSDVQGRQLSLNPMTFKESAGLSRTLIDQENRKLLTRLGVAFIQNSRKYYPAALPSTVTESETSTEIAAEWVTEYKAAALEGRVDWDSKLTLSLPVSYSGKDVFEAGFTPVGNLPDDIANYTTTVDADWENTFSTNITKVISVKLFLRWVYDKYDNTVKPVVDDTNALANAADVERAIRKAGQFKQTLALGFGYTFN